MIGFFTAVTYLSGVVEITDDMFILVIENTPVCGQAALVGENLHGFVGKEHS